MAIIRPSIKFEGSELNLSSAAPYIIESVRRAVFNKTTNTDGAYLYFLPAYKADRAGNGVWYKKISVRDNFGLNYKEKYFVQNRSQDPAEYFAANFKLLYPEDARVVDSDVNGKKYKKYPAHGRITERVIYNVAFAQNLATGAHVLDLPLRNGADGLMNWVEGKDSRGNSRPPINDPDRCLPVFVKLKENSANPWVLQVENDSPVQLPQQLADSDYLYNLDEILVIKSNEEIIAKLREMYSVDVFDDCMNGFAGLTKKASQVGYTQPYAQPAEIRTAQMEIAKPAFTPPTAQMEIAKPVIATAPVIDIPRASLTVPVAPVNPPPAADISTLPPNPMARSRLSREEALGFLNQD